MLRRRWVTALLFAACLLTLVACDPAPGPVGTPSPVVTPTVDLEPTPTAAGALPPGCLAAQMTGVAGWQGATGGLAGGIFLLNNGSDPCTLQGRPGVHVVGANGGMLAVTDVEATGETTPCCAPVIVLPGGKAFINFVWRNWCGQASGPFTLAFALPGDGGQLNIPVLDPSGAPLSDTPRCDTNNLASTIQVGRFMVPTGP